MRTPFMAIVVVWWCLVVFSVVEEFGILGDKRWSLAREDVRGGGLWV